MPNLEELIKIREEAIKKHIDANVLEKFLFDCTKKYYDDFIVKKLTSQAEGDLKNSDISVFDSGIFITTDNKEKSNLFFDEIMYKGLKIFSYDDIDNVSTKDDPIVYVKYFKGFEEYNYFIRLAYLKKFVEDDGYNFKMKFSQTLNSYDELYVEFEILSKIPRLAFSKQKILIKKP